MRKGRYPKRREPIWPKLFLGIITVLQIALTIVLHVMNRQETLKVIGNEEGKEVLMKKKKESRRLSGKTNQAK